MRNRGESCTWLGDHTRSPSSFRSRECTSTGAARRTDHTVGLVAKRMARASASTFPGAAGSVSRVVLLAPGRSGSTLLQSAFLSSCDVLTFFEPCHHGAGGGGDVLHGKCVRHIKRFLSCDLPKKNGRWDPPSIRPWLQHPYNAANTSCTRPPFASAEKMQAVCHSARLVLVKEIRLVGKLQQLAATLTRHYLQQHPRPPARSVAIVHLVRDPRPTLASQRRLHWWKFGNTSLQSKQQLAHEMARVAKHLCRGILADVTAGERLQRNEASLIRYVPVRFEELATNLAATTERLYGALGLLPVPHTTQEWIQRTLSGQCAHGDAASANNESTLEKFEYSTCRSKTAPSRGAHGRWKHDLSRLEKRAIARGCATAMARLGYGAQAQGGTTRRQDVRSL